MQKPYARSEIHLTELFESICEKFSQYALTKNSKGGKSVVPTASRDGKGIALKDVTISSDATKQMKYTVSIKDCHERPFKEYVCFSSQAYFIEFFVLVH